MFTKKFSFHALINIISALVLVGTLIYLVIAWINIPDEVPGHYNSSGEITRWGDKSEIWMVFAINLFLYLLFTAIEFILGKQKFTNQIVCQTLSDMMATIKFVLLAVFTYMIIIMSLAIEMHTWFLPISLILIFGPLVYFIIRLILLSRRT